MDANNDSLERLDARLKEKELNALALKLDTKDNGFAKGYHSGQQSAYEHARFLLAKHRTDDLPDSYREFAEPGCENIQVGGVADDQAENPNQ